MFINIIKDPKISARHEASSEQLSFVWELLESLLKKET
jgi:hypothetical protein